MESDLLDKALDLLVVAESNLCMEKSHPFHSRHMDGDDGGSCHGDSRNAMGRKMDLVQNFDIPFDETPFYGN